MYTDPSFRPVREKEEKHGGRGTHLLLRWPSSTSPSSSATRSIATTSVPSPLTITLVSSRSNHCFAHAVTVLFFQCQLAVLEAMGGGIVAIVSERLVYCSKDHRKVANSRIAEADGWIV